MSGIGFNCFRGFLGLSGVAYLATQLTPKPTTDDLEYEILKLIPPENLTPEQRVKAFVSFSPLLRGKSFAHMSGEFRSVAFRNRLIQEISCSEDSGLTPKEIERCKQIKDQFINDTLQLKKSHCEQREHARILMFMMMTV